MAGRHRAQRKPTPWRTAAAAGTTATGLLVAAVWATGTFWTPPETSGAALSLSANRVSAVQSTTPTSTRTKSPTPKPKPKPKPKPEPSPTTTTPPVTTTTSEKPPPPPPPPPESCPSDLEGTQPHVAQVGHHIMGKFGVDSVIGVSDRSGSSDHPSGLALDFMVDSETGDAIAEYVLDNQDDFGVTYVIWAQRYNDGSGWSTMEDRGSTTANHYDHVHVSFDADADVSVTC